LIVISFFHLHEKGYVTRGLGLVSFLHFVYVFHFFWVEENVLSMIDFTSENMGWMLGWGNVTWVGCTFALPALFVFRQTPHAAELPWLGCVLILCFWASGYIIFAGANTQKDQFRRDNTKPIWGKPPVTLKTSAGKQLLMSGWWGIARHMVQTKNKKKQKKKKQEIKIELHWRSHHCLCFCNALFAFRNYSIPISRVSNCSPHPQR
jgi:hypothetical protein